MLSPKAGTATGTQCLSLKELSSADDEILSPLRIDRCPWRAPHPNRMITSAGLLARGSKLHRAFPARTWARQWQFRLRSPLTVAGAAAGLAYAASLHSLFI